MLAACFHGVPVDGENQHTLVRTLEVLQKSCPLKDDSEGMTARH